MKVNSFIFNATADYINICSAKDANLEKCLIDSGHQLLQKLEKGIPEYEIPPVDPMAVPKLGLQRTDLGMSLFLINSTHTGLASTKINRARWVHNTSIS